MVLDLDRLDRERRDRARSRHAGRTMTGPLPPANQESLGFLDTAGDILAAPLRGVEGAAQDVYGLADAITAGALPDWEERFFGESRTRTGGAVEGIVNFASGFIPVYGWLGKAGKAGRILKQSTVLRGAVAGAITDFSVFDGHEERLSDLIQSFPALQNPVSEFLAANPDDVEIEGRLKNTLEGLGIGAVTDLALHSLKAYRAGSRARAAGKSFEEVERAMDAAAPPEALQEAARKPNQILAEPVPPVPASAVAPEAGAATEAVGEVAESAAGSVKSPNPVDILRTFDIDEKQAAEILTAKRNREAPIRATATELVGLPPQNPKTNPRNMTEAALVAQNMERSDLNLSRYHGPEGAQQLLRAMEQVLEPFPHLGEATAVSLKEQEKSAFLELADMVQEKNPQRLMVQMQQDLASLPAVNRRILAYKTALNSYAGYLDGLAKKLGTPAATDLTRMEFRQGLNTLAEMELAVKGLLGEQGRGLGANRIPTKYVSDLLGKADVEEALHGFGGNRRIDELAAKFRVVREGAGTAGVVDLARATAGRRRWAMFDEYWYNSLLGRPTTIVVNGMSGLLTTVYRPMELMIGGVLTGRSEVLAEVTREISYIAGAVSESMQAAAAAMRGGGQLLDPTRIVHDTVDPLRKAITSKNLGLGADTVAGRATDWFGRLVRMPSMALTATDQFVKHMNYRGMARAQLLKEATKKGLTGEAAARFVADDMDKLLFEGQAYGSAMLYNRGAKEAVQLGKVGKVAVEEHARQYVANIDPAEHARLSNIAAKALERAEEVTFSKPLRPGTLAYRVQEAALNHRVLRLIMPFVRTPVNIASFALQRLDVPHAVQAAVAAKFPKYAASLSGAQNRMLMDILSGDPRRKADAVGRLAGGISISSYLILKAGEAGPEGLPLVTGAGPKDREQRRVLEDAGWQPYSIRVGDTYVSYSRLDPFAAIMGTTADILDYMRFAAPEDQGTAESLVFGLAVSLAQNFTNKTYLAGLSNAIEAVQDPQNKVPKLVSAFAASFVPGQAAATVSVADPLLRDVRSMADAMAARLPGASDNLPPLRNVLGEPVRRAKSLGGGVSTVFNAFVPILYREVSDDEIRKEMAALNYGFTPPRRTMGSVELTSLVNKQGQNAYDRWLELHGEVELGGRTLKQSLRRLFRGDAYQRTPADSTEDVESPRIGLTRGVIDDYRAAALRQLLREFPELDESEKSRRQRRARARAGRQGGTTILNQLRGR